MCKSWCEGILAIIIIVFAFWSSWQYSQWIIIIAAVLLLIHSFTCKKCFTHGMNKDMNASMRRKRR